MSNQEISRRSQYCQFIDEITGSDEYLVIGIDVGKNKHHAFMGTATGVCLFRKLIFDNDICRFSRKITRKISNKMTVLQMDRQAV